MVLNDNMIALCEATENGEVTQRKDVPEVVKALNTSCKKLSGLFPRCKTVSQVFGHPMIISASNELKKAALLSLQDNSEASSSLKTLELVWGKCFYEPLVFAKKLAGVSPKDKLTQSDKSFFIQHLKTGRKYFVELEDSFSKMREIMDPILINRLIHRTFVCLGDLSRYELDYVDDDKKPVSLEVSKNYYKKAILIQIENGFPYNQLAVLLKDRNFGLDSVIYYIKGASVDESFALADENLKQALKKVKKTDFGEMTKTLEPSLEKLIALWLQIPVVGVLETENLTKMKRACQESMSYLLRCLRDSKLDSSHPAKGILPQLVVLPLLLVQKLGQTRENENLVSLLTAFELGLFNTLVKKFVKDLCVFVYGREIEIVVTEENEEVKSDAKGVDRRRRRKNHQDKTQSDSESDLEDSSKECESEVECLEDQQDFEDESDQEGSGILYSDSEDGSSEDDFSDSFSVEDRMDAMEVAIFVGSHGFSEVLGICGYWLMHTPGLITGSDSGSDILRHNLEKAFEVLRLENFKNGKKVVKFLNGYKSTLSERPFPEEFETCGIKIFSERHSSLDWESLEDLMPEKLGVLRLNQMFSLRDWLKTIPKSSPSENLENVKEAVPDKRKVLMQNMAQLWLQQEVNNLEDVNHSLSYPLYLVVDHWTLICHLSVVKRIVGTKKIVVVIPHAAIQELDFWKRDEPMSRNAIFWLEKEFKHGNRWLRPEKPDENLSFDPEIYGSKSSKAEKNVIGILECAHFYAKKQQKVSVDKSENLILLTVGKDECEARVKGFRACPDAKDLMKFKEMALNHGIEVQEALTFFNQFKISFPSIFNAKALNDSNRKMRRRKPRTGP